jgi:ubiquinone/menaquinone biosynthesis C-methylase UbiE
MLKALTRSCIIVLGSTIAFLAARTAAFKTIAATSPRNITNTTKHPTSTCTAAQLTRRSFVMSTSVLATSSSSSVAPDTTTTTPTPTTPTKVEVEVVVSKEEAKNNKIWSRFADNYAKQPIADEETYQKKLEITRGYLTPASNVLEFGCGTGATAILHAPYVKRIHAVDVSSRMIEIAKEKQQAAADDANANADNVQFECTGIDSLQVPDESFDVVLGMSILHLLPNKDEIIAKVRTNLKPGGYFISSTACIGDHAKFLAWIAPIGNWFGIIPTLNIFTKAELRKSIEDGGFQIEQEFHPAVGKGVFLVARKM